MQLVFFFYLLSFPSVRVWMEEEKVLYLVRGLRSDMRCHAQLQLLRWLCLFDREWQDWSLRQFGDVLWILFHHPSVL